MSHAASSPSPDPQAPLSFEDALRELDDVVQRLENGNLCLEDSLALYERGVTLAAHCHQRLQDAERRIEVLTERGRTQPAPAELTRDLPDEDRL